MLPCFIYRSYHNQIFDLRAGAGASSTSVGPLPGNWLAARIADLTPDLHVLLSWGSTVVSFHSQQTFSVSFFHVSLGLPAPSLPSTCISHAVLTAPLERSTCPNQGSLLSLRMRSSSSSSSFASSSLDLTVATSYGLILQICLIMALPLRCIIWAATWENLSSGVCEQHRRRPACASAQSDQRLCYSLFGKYHM